MTAAALAHATKLGEPKISRWLSGQQTFIDGDDLELVVTHLTDKPAERAELVAARMRDVCTGPGSDLIEINIGGNDFREASPAYDTKLPVLPPPLEHATQIFARFWKDPDVRGVVTGLANVLETGDARSE